MKRGRIRWWLDVPGKRVPCLIAAALTVMLLGLSGLNKVAAAPGALRISVSQTPLSLPIYVAENQGYFAAEGVNVKISEVNGGHRSLRQLLDGTADLATASEAVVMINSFQRNDFAIIATFVTSYDDVKIIVRAESGISSLAHLANKRVGTVTGTAGHYYLDAVLLLNGVDPLMVRPRNLQPEAMADALKRRELDAVAVWEPFSFKILSSVPGARLLPGSHVYRLNFNLIAHKKLAGVRDDDLVKLLRAMDRANQFIYGQPRKAQAILKRCLKLDQPFIDWIWSRYTYQLSLDQSLLATLEGEARWARQEKIVKGTHSPNYLNYIYSEPLRRLRPAAVSIIR